MGTLLSKCKSVTSKDRLVNNSRTVNRGWFQCVHEGSGFINFESTLLPCNEYILFREPKESSILWHSLGVLCRSSIYIYIDAVSISFVMKIPERRQRDDHNCKLSLLIHFDKYIEILVSPIPVVKKSNIYLECVAYGIANVYFPLLYLWWADGKIQLSLSSVYLQHSHEKMKYF